MLEFQFDITSASANICSVCTTMFNSVSFLRITETNLALALCKQRTTFISGGSNLRECWSLLMENKQRQQRLKVQNRHNREGMSVYLKKLFLSPSTHRFTRINFEHVLLQTGQDEVSSNSPFVGLGTFWVLTAAVRKCLKGQRICWTLSLCNHQLYLSNNYVNVGLKTMR